MSKIIAAIEAELARVDAGEYDARAVEINADTPDEVVDGLLFGPPPEAANTQQHDFWIEIADLLDGTSGGVSRERQIAQDLRLYVESHTLTDDQDWLAFAAYTIECVTHTRDLTAADIERALDSPLAFPLPDFDDL